MPRIEFKCDRGHVTEKVLAFDTVLPKWIRCKAHRTCRFAHISVSALHVCGLQAKRVEVYQVGVTGDLPTRGSF